MAQAMQAAVTLTIEYPRRLSRLHLLLKTFLGWVYVGVPHGIILYIYGILAQLATFIAFFAILITGRFPRGLFNFVVGYQRWSTRVLAYWFFHLVDAYPPFSNSAPSNPVTLEVAYPQRLSRGLVLLKLFLGWAYAGIPHGIVLFFYVIAVLVVLFVAWWTILIIGRSPRGLFNFVVGWVRWSTRLNIYLLILRDEYPPFHGRP